MKPKPLIPMDISTPAPRRACAVLCRAAFLLLALLALPVPCLQAQVPGILSYQGRITVNNANFSGSGQFKFALVNAAGNTSYWSHDNTSTSGNEPVTAVAIPVTNGIYSVLLGDTTIPGMSTPVPGRIFAENGDVRVRVWFNDGINGFQLLSPDQRIAAVGYALNAAGAVFSGAQEFKTPGTSTFTVPQGVTKILVEVWGGGGGFYNSMGSGGAYSRKSFAVKPGDQWTVVVGAAGANSTGAPGNVGTAGGASSVTSVTVPGSSLISEGGAAGVGFGVTVLPAQPDPAADVGRPGSAVAGGPFYFNVGTVSPPVVFNPAVPPNSASQTVASAPGAGAGPGMYSPPGPGYVLIQW